MGNTLTIRLEGDDLDQLLGGQRCRLETSHGTTEYLESGYSARDDFSSEECRDAEDAREIAAHYDRIIATLDARVDAQGEML